ncbi:MAG: hypothetical protein ACREV9_01590 [Burkholderiales bacterium]
MEFDLPLLAGCTTVYLEDFEIERPRQRAQSAVAAPRVEQTIERILGVLEADLRLANLGSAWFPG